MALCCLWLKEFISREHLAGSTGDVSPPLVARVFQFLSDATSMYNQCRKIAYTPFPFRKYFFVCVCVCVCVVCVCCIAGVQTTNATFFFSTLSTLSLSLSLYVPAHAQLTSFFILVSMFVFPYLYYTYVNNIVLACILNFTTLACFEGMHEVARELTDREYYCVCVCVCVCVYLLISPPHAVIHITLRISVYSLLSISERHPTKQLPGTVQRGTNK
jgi:hypothetical protein